MSAEDEKPDETTSVVNEMADGNDIVNASEQPAPSKPEVIFQPNATLYVSNVDWSIKKNILRRSLLALFGRHGKVVEVITLRRECLRGQAWIIFQEISSAISAQRDENGFTFFGKPLKIEFAREKSDRIAKRDGTFVPKDRRMKRVRAVASTKTDNGTTAFTQQTNIESFSVSHNNPSSLGLESNPMNHLSSVPPPTPLPTTDQEGHSQKATQEDTLEPTETEESPPSNILFAEDLPSECNEMMLAMLFRQYMGYKEVRIPRTGLAFIEFDDEPHATLALRGLNGFHITSADNLDLKYSK